MMGRDVWATNDWAEVRNRIDTFAPGYNQGSYDPSIVPLILPAIAWQLKFMMVMGPALGLFVLTYALLGATYPAAYLGCTVAAAVVLLIRKMTDRRFNSVVVYCLIVDAFWLATFMLTSR
jgi:hypothetical protein